MLIVAALAAALSSAQLDLHLLCTGIERGQRRLTALTSHQGSDLKRQSGSINMMVPYERETSVEVTFKGDGGELVRLGERPDRLRKVMANDQIISMRSIWGISFEINRLTGAVHIDISGSNHFDGKCEMAPAEPAAPKF